jgi:hypothetical protein
MGLESKTKKGLRDWLQRQAYLDDEEKGPISRIVVYQVTTTGKRGPEVGSVRLPVKADSHTITNVANEIDSIATNDTEGSGQTQRYAITAMHKGSDGEYSAGAKMTIRVAPSQDEDGEMMSEAPTSAGITSQAMRHTEVFARIAVGSAESTIRSLTRQLETTQAQNEKLLDKNFELTELMETLMSHKHEREIASQEASARISNKQELVHKLMLIAPILANKLFGGKDGKKILKENTTPLEQILHSLIVSIKPEQFEQLQQVLTPDQQMALGTMFQEVSKFEVKSLGDGGRGSNGSNANNGRS